MSIAAGATLCGMKGYRAMANWAKDLGDKARERLGCRRVKGRYGVPSESTIRKAHPVQTTSKSPRQTMDASTPGRLGVVRNAMTR
jgi:hypothetical protein